MTITEKQLMVLLQTAADSLSLGDRTDIRLFVFTLETRKQTVEQVMNQQNAILTVQTKADPTGPSADARHAAGGFYCQNCSLVLCENQGDICASCRAAMSDVRAGR